MCRSITIYSYLSKNGTTIAASSVHTHCRYVPEYKEIRWRGLVTTSQWKYYMKIWRLKKVVLHSSKINILSTRLPNSFILVHPVDFSRNLAFLDDEVTPFVPSASNHWYPWHRIELSIHYTKKLSKWGGDASGNLLAGWLAEVHHG